MAALSATENISRQAKPIEEFENSVKVRDSKLKNPSVIWYTFKCLNQVWQSCPELVADGSSHYKTLQENRMEEQNMWKKMAAAAMAALTICLSTACGLSADESSDTEDYLQDETEVSESIVTSQEEPETSGNIVTNLEKIDMSKWMYHAEDNVYYQIGISYCETPADPAYETLAVFVPDDYFSGTDNGVQKPGRIRPA